MAKLTAQSVRDLPLTKKGQKLFYDETLPGFGVRVGSTRKTYIVDSRVKGRSRRITLGRVDTMTYSDAKKAAVKALAEMAEGKDRNAQHRLERARLITLGEAVERWLSERPMKTRTRASYLLTMKREFGPWFDKEMRSISPKMFQARFQEILERTPSGAALAVRTFKSCWSWAQADVVDESGLPLLPACPADLIKAKKMMPKAKRRQSFVSDWRAFFRALDQLNIRSNRHPAACYHFKVFVELLARTGMRRSEAANIEWKHVDMPAKTFTIPMELTKNGEPLTLPMSTQTYAIFEMLATENSGKKYIWGDAPIGDPRKNLDHLREALGWSVDFHDLRRSFSTLATELDIQQAKITRLLNHSTRSNVTLGYQVSKNPESLRGAVQLVSDTIDAMRGT